jgi:signal transduction histidine kinase
MSFRTIATIFLMIYPFVTFAGSTIIIDDDNKDVDQFNIGPILETYEAKSDELSVEKVTDKKFTTLNRDVPNFGYTSNPVWARFKVKNNLDKEIHWILNYERSRVDYLTLYIYENGENVKTVETGRLFPFNSREIKHRDFIFDIEFPKKSETTIYLKILSESHIKFPIQMMRYVRFMAHDHDVQLVLGIYYGIMLIMTIYNLIIYFVVRDNSYLYYVASIFATHVVGKMSLNGMDYEYLWPNSPNWSKSFLPFILALSVFFILKLFVSFRDVDRKYPRFDRVNFILMCLCPIGAALPFLLKNMSASIIVQLFTLASILYMLGGSIYCVSTGDRLARYFLFSWLGFLLGYIVRFLMAIGFLDTTFITTYSLHLGATLQVTVLSLGLGNRIKKLKEQKHLAEKANEMKSMFLANISHDIRTPLHGILSHAQFGLSRIDRINKDKILKYFSNIKESGERLLHLLNDLLDLSKLESGRIVYDMKLINISKVLKRSIVEFNACMEKKDIELEYDLSNFDFEVVCDSLRLRQVFSNILSNATKFTDQSGQIKLLSEEKSMGYIISIVDNGVGIPEKELVSIFEVFTQSSNEVNEKRGTGLGLSISKKIVEDHKGKIWAENNKNGGASINIMLPKPDANDLKLVALST